MRRSICLTEPSVAYAGEVSTWKFTYTTAINLPKGARIKFDMQSKGREIDWRTPEADSKKKSNIIWGTLPNGKNVAASLLESPDGVVPDFEFTLPSEVKAGEDFVIQIGTPYVDKKKITTHGSRAQTVVQRRKQFLLFVDPKGKGDYKDADTFSLDIKGNKLHFIRVIAPSAVAKNKRFDMVLRFEDEFGNLTNNAPEGTLIELTYEHLRENLSWKLFVPETGFLSLPNLYFNEPGVYKIQLQNLSTKETFHSYPIKCFASDDHSLFWGLLHGESDRVDSAENIETCLRHLRDEKSFQFFASSSFESAEETPNEIWKGTCAQITEFNEESRFAAFLGMQWFSPEKNEGLRSFVFAKDNKAILRKKDAKSNSLKKIYKGLLPKELLSIPSFTMAKGMGSDFSDFSPDYERVVEIYNAWGSSECSKKEGNLRPIEATTKKGVFEDPAGSIRAALNKNHRFGFVAGGLDDRGVFSPFYEGDQVQYSPGFTGIIAKSHTREELFTSLWNRRCYATTGERIILGFSIAGGEMGSELSTKAKPGLAYNRHISGYVAGTAPIVSIELIRNGSVIDTKKPNEFHLEFTFDDSEMIDTVALTPPKGSPSGTPSFVYYYIRVIQEDGHVAWSSPIWVDLDAHLAAPTRKKRK